MKREHKEELKRILDTYDDRIKDAEARANDAEAQAIELIRAKREEMLTLVNDMATWKMGQLFSSKGQLWQVTDIRSCATSMYCDLEVAYTVTALNSKGKLLSEVYRVNLSEEDIAREQWQPISDRKDVYVLPAQIMVKELKVIKEDDRTSLYFIKDAKGKYYTFEYDTNLLNCSPDRGLMIKRRTSGRSAVRGGQHYMYGKSFKRGRFHCQWIVKNLRPVTKDDKEVISMLVEELV